MLELIALVCLVAAPDKCKDATVAYAPEGMSLQACTTQAMPQLAKWAGDNPGWAVKSWHCRKQGKKETNA